MKKRYMFVSCLAACSPFFTSASDIRFTPEDMTFGLSLGTLSGQTKERVYSPEDGGSKVSQLNWKYNNAAVISASMDWDVMSRVSLGLSGWSTLGSRSANMDDYDWLAEDQKGWSHWSHHPNTRLNFANEFDVNVKFWALEEPAYRLGMMLGYKENRYSFNATGGHYIYENGQDIGDLPNQTVISYMQQYKMPYVGLTGLYRYENWELGGTFKFSPWVKSSDTDNHFLTDTKFTGSIHRQKYYSLTGNVGYYATEKMKVYLEGAWSRVANKKGTLTVNDHEEGSVTALHDSAGIENYNFMATVGLKYTF